MAQDIDNRPEYTGKDKAAILMLSLPEEQANKVFAMLDDDEIRDISKAMSNLGVVDSNYVEQLYIEFVSDIATINPLVGSLETTEKFLSKFLEKDQIDKIIEDLQGPSGRTVWDKLNNVNEELLANYLKNEHPQTVSVVLSKIKSENAARVLSFLSGDFANEVVARMLKMESIRKEILMEVENTLKTEFMTTLSGTNKRDVYEMVADIFNYLDKSSETRLLQGLEDVSPESAKRIRSLMFIFDDLVELDPNSMQTLLRFVDRNKLALALKGATDKIREVFLSSMSARASKLLQDDMGNMGMVRIRDVETAQYEIVNIAKELAAKDEIRIASNKDSGSKLIG